MLGTAKVCASSFYRTCKWRPIPALMARADVVGDGLMVVVEGERSDSTQLHRESDRIMGSFLA